MDNNGPSASKKVSNNELNVPLEKVNSDAKPKRNIAKMVNQANQNLKNNFNDIDSV